MSHLEAAVPTVIYGPARYRAAFLAAGGILSSVLLVLAEVLVPGRPFGGIEIAMVLIAAVTTALVYYPENPWLKVAAAVLGSVAQLWFAAWSDDRVTFAEWVVIITAALGALGVGAAPNPVVPQPALKVIDDPASD